MPTTKRKEGGRENLCKQTVCICVCACVRACVRVCVKLVDPNLFERKRLWHYPGSAHL